MRKIAAGIAAASAAALAMGVAAPATANGTGTKPLAAVLTSDGNTFDRNAHDYDIVTQAVLAVLKAKPSSPVGVLADGTVKLTAFIPNDAAFRLLVKDLTGTTYSRESDVYKQVRGLGVDTVEDVLLYHVVPGSTIPASAALKSDGARLTTALGPTFRVNVDGKSIFLVDRDPNSRDPRVNVVDINKGNRQIAHGIDRVLRPMDIPPISGQRSLATVLTSDGNTFDHNAHDYDIVTQAVLAVLKAKPSSPVGVLADGSVRLTAFVPNDAAFRLLVKDLTGTTYSRESTVFAKVAGLGIDTVEDVLLYHVVPGATIPAAKALKSDGANLKTALGSTFRVNVNGSTISLSDKDGNSRNPRVNVVDINKGNRQIAHGIDRVLRPMDLPPTVK
jgi:uncharacterized surface protein with fasciclin (FAS1) repeats